MKIYVLGGGDSPEREVSLRSAKAMANAGRQAGFGVEEFDPAAGLAFLDNAHEDSLVFPILHGKGGEDGQLQSELEKRNIAFLGSGSESSKNSFDKWQTRLILQKNSVPMAEAVKVTKDTYAGAKLASKPHVIKVLHGGSSIGTLMVRDPAKLNPQDLDEIFGMENEAVLESLVEGIEVTVPILDQSALPAIEVRPPEGGEFDYENKYNGQSAELCPPPSLSDAQHDQAKQLAEMVHSVMGCRHLSRVDTIMRPDGSFIVLEINTIPGLTDQSLYPKSAGVSGLDMPQLFNRFVELVKRDYNL